MNLFIKDFPEDIWARFRAMSLLKGKTVKQLMIELLTEATAHLEAEQAEEKR